MFRFANPQYLWLLLAIPAFSPFGAAVGSLSDHELYRQLAKETDTPR